MIDKIKLKWLYILSAVFIVLNVICIVQEFYWLAMVPLVLLLVVLFFFALDRLLLLIVFLTPLAINIENFDSNFAISLPTEPLLLGVLFLFLLKLLFDRELIPRKLVVHPVTIAILAYLFWMFLTSITSEFPLVSFKYLLSRLWFIIPMYFLMVLVFRRVKRIKTFMWLYVISLIIVVFYSTINLFQWGFNENAAHWVMSPFYNDHTAYGAALSFFVPVVFGFLLFRGLHPTEKIFLGIAFSILMMGLVLSYSRAAWISVVAALCVALVFIFHIRIRWIVVTLLMLVGLFFAFQQQIIMKMEKNKQDASVNLAEHIQSISNISSDASNLERMNRWNSAFRMFALRPFWGWGPGTYQFVYAPFQLSKDKTIISTNAGNRGNAHSEYIGPLCEQGVLGVLTVLGLLGAVIWTMIRIWRDPAKRKYRHLALIFFLGLVTYYVHGTLNNFLDTDKASVPFWSFIAVLVSIDIFHYGKNPGSTTGVDEK